jgi:hypothetical protein
MAEIEDIQNLDIIDTERLELELGRFRSGYYRDRFRLLAGVIFFLAIINAILVAVVFYLYLVQPKVPEEFYTSNLHNGANARIYSLDQPLLKPKNLIEWTQNSIVKSFDFNFVNYREAFDNIRKYYTENGWNTFHELLSKSKLIDIITSNKYFLSSDVAGDAVILEDGIVNGHHAWRLRIPMVLKFKTSEHHDARPHMQQKVTVDAIIVRVPNIENPESIGIDSLNLAWEGSL